MTIEEKVRTRSAQLMKEERWAWESTYAPLLSRYYPDDFTAKRELWGQIMTYSKMALEGRLERSREEFKEHCQYVRENAPKTIMKEISELKGSNFELRLKETLGVTVSKKNAEPIINEDYISSLPFVVLNNYKKFITQPLEYFMQCAMNMSLPFKYEIMLNTISTKKLLEEHFFDTSKYPIKDRDKDVFSHTERAPEFISILKEIFQFILPSFNIELIAYFKQNPYLEFFRREGYDCNEADIYEFFFRATLS